jgi:hypothetical protein
VTFHPKLYCFFTPSAVRLVAGSANLTGGGMETNLEVSVSIRSSDSDPIADQIRKLRKQTQEIAHEATELRIRQYERTFRITEKQRKAASKAAADEIRQIENIDPEKIQMYLDRYRRSSKGQVDFANRQNNYRQARKELDRICDEKIKSKAQFLRLYSALVGNRGQGSLFWSNGLFRYKNKVAENWRMVVKMIRAIRANLTLPDDRMFALASTHADRVNGLGVNVITEILNTYAPRKFSVLNANPVTSLQYFGIHPFKAPNAFTPEDYVSYNAILRDLRDTGKLASFAQVDHFLNFVYQRLKKRHRLDSKKGRPSRSAR